MDAISSLRSADGRILVRAHIKRRLVESHFNCPVRSEDNCEGVERNLRPSASPVLKEDRQEFLRRFILSQLLTLKDSV